MKFFLTKAVNMIILQVCDKTLSLLTIFQFRWLGVPLSIFFARAAREPIQNNSGGHSRN
jgi:hypothetical protein